MYSVWHVLTERNTEVPSDKMVIDINHKSPCLKTQGLGIKTVQKISLVGGFCTV